jgi:hypothetical protein
MLDATPNSTLEGPPTIKVPEISTMKIKTILQIPAPLQPVTLLNHGTICITGDRPVAEESAFGASLARAEGTSCE